MVSHDICSEFIASLLRRTVNKGDKSMLSSTSRIRKSQRIEANLLTLGHFTVYRSFQHAKVVAAPATNSGETGIGHFGPHPFPRIECPSFVGKLPLGHK